jgi:hypothetical protein
MYKLLKQGRCIKGTADHAAGGGSRRRGRVSGRQGAKYESPSKISNFRGLWLFQKPWIAPPPAITTHQNPELYVRRTVRLGGIESRF